MNIPEWRCFFRTLTIEGDTRVFLPPPSVATFRDYEARMRFKLPSSYKSFIRIYGPGELAWEYQITAPGYSGRETTVDMDELNAHVRARLTKKRLNEYADPVKAARLHFFSRSSSRELIGWDPAEVTDSRRHEHAIYALSDAESPLKLADSFDDFILKVCMSHSNLQIPGRDESLGSRRSFAPACKVDAVGNRDK